MTRFAPILFVLLLGCALPPVPQTPVERYYAAETSFNIALQTVIALRDNGVLKPNTTAYKAIQDAVASVNSGLREWGANLGSGEREAAVRAALGSLKALLGRVR